MITVTISTPVSTYSIEIQHSNFHLFDKLIDSTVANMKMDLLSHIYHDHPSIYHSTSPTPDISQLTEII
jgi:hypothetical protein